MSGKGGRRPPKGKYSTADVLRIVLDEDSDLSDEEFEVNFSESESDVGQPSAAGKFRRHSINRLSSK